MSGLLEPAAKPLEFAYASPLGKLAREGLEYVLTRGIIKLDISEDKAQHPAITVLRDHVVVDLKLTEEIPLKGVATPSAASDVLGEYLSGAAKAAAVELAGDRGKGDWAKLQNAAFEMAKPLLIDTLFFDQVYTEGERERARHAVPPVMKEVQPGEVIQQSHHRWTPQALSDVQTYLAKLQSQDQRENRIFVLAFAQAIFVALMLWGLARSAALLTPRYERQQAARNLNLALLVMCATLVLGRLTSYFEPSGFVLPITAGAILLAILVSARFAVMAGLMTAALVSIQFGYDWRLLFVSSCMLFGGVLGMYRVRKRGDMTRAALKATAMGLVAMLAVTLAMDSLASGPALRRLLMVLFNGGACIFIVPGVLGPLERLFGITTDIQLLEYSDLNNEVLSRMAIEMPGTYSHSLMLGQLAEAAADVVGANGLLARVQAYYHDIGKLRRPEYFSENQTGTNIHDGLPPRLSARAIASHVACGVELAREYHLPKPIVDGIREHHGTTLISFFHQKAIEQNKHDEVREEDFRYPGPKPQGRETAILMICDAVESGVRSIKNPNEDRVREFIDKIITNRSMDRQFDQCGLALKDLDILKETLARRMTSALHARVAYPDRPPDKKVDNVVTLSGGSMQ